MGSGGYSLGPCIGTVSLDVDSTVAFVWSRKKGCPFHVSTKSHLSSHHLKWRAPLSTLKQLKLCFSFSGKIEKKCQICCTKDMSVSQCSYHPGSGVLLFELCSLYMDRAIMYFSLIHRKTPVTLGLFSSTAFAGTTFFHLHELQYIYRFLFVTLF